MGDTHLWQARRSLELGAPRMESIAVCVIKSATKAPHSQFGYLYGEFASPALSWHMTRLDQIDHCVREVLHLRSRAEGKPFASVLCTGLKERIERPDHVPEYSAY
jgi:hypothetical protein